jgi:hypothetical protein
MIEGRNFMDASINKRYQSVLWFFLAGVVAGFILWGITRMVDVDGLWYFSSELWIRPTYLNFLIANLLGICAAVLAYQYAKQQGGASSVGSVTTPFKLFSVFALLIVHSLIFWFAADPMMYPSSILVASLLLSLSISSMLRFFSGFWAISVSLGIILWLLVAPVIATLLPAANAAEFLYPVILPGILGLAGYWLVLKPETDKAQQPSSVMQQNNE